MGESRSLVVRYYLYQATLSLGFYVPVSVVFLLDRGFGLGFVAVADATFSVALLLSEVPTGYLGDRLGRRRTLVLGNACRVVAVGGYAVADAAATFLVLKVFFAVGWALRSGTADAYLYELLRERFDEDRFATVRGRGTAVQLATSALTALAGGYLYTVDPKVPFVLSAAVAAAGVPILLTFPDAEEADAEGFTVVRATRTLTRQVRRPDVRWLVAYSVLVLLAFDVTRTFEQPAFRSLGSGAMTLGALYAAFKLVSALGGAAVGPLRDRLGTKRLLALLSPFVGVAYAGLLVWPAFLLPVAFCYRFARTVLHPVRNQYLNDRLADAGRATVLSGASMLLSAAGAAARLAGSRVVSLTGPVELVGLSGVVLASAAGVVWVVANPVRAARSGTPSAEGGAND